MTNQFKINFKQQLLMLAPAIIKILAIALIVYYKYPNDWQQLLLIFLPIFFIVDTLPAIIVHIQYLFKNKNVSIIFNSEKRTIDYSNKNESIIVSYDDIKSLQHYASFGGGLESTVGENIAFLE